jgi:hypothetical protein
MNSQANSTGMEGGPPLQSHAWETTLARNTYIANRATRILVDKLESIANWKKIWIINKRWAYL